MANSSMFVLPIITQPAALSFVTTVASYGATKLSSIRDPQVVRMPSVQKMSLCAMGTPVKVSLKGQPVFLCCEACLKKAQAKPDKTLEKVKAIKAKGAGSSSP